MGEKRGSICFFATYRPPVALDIYSVPYPLTSSSSPKDAEVCMTDTESYNYNGKHIPKNALKNMLKNPKIASETGAGPEDVESGRVSGGLLFVSERDHGLETLHIAVRFRDSTRVEVVNFAEVYGTFDGARLEDGGCFSEDSIIYVSTKENPNQPHQPWNAVFQTNLTTGVTHRLTPKGVADFSPSISPDGRRLVVASLQDKPGGWCGEIEDLETNIFLIDLKYPSDRDMIVEDGGWPTWGSDNVLFFHRNVEKVKMKKIWGVFCINVDEGLESDVVRVTPEEISAITPAAIDATTVAVATIRKPSGFGVVRDKEQFRHIEVFRVSNEPQNEKISQIIRPLADHFNPFVIVDNDGQKHIGYHRCKVTDNVNEYTVVETKFQKIKGDEPEIGAFRVSGVFPSFSPDGKKLAFVDNEFRGVWVADEEGMRMIIELEADSFFAPVWNQNPKYNILYLCNGQAFHAKEELHICYISNPGKGKNRRKQLTSGFNNAFPSTNSDGTKLVFRSTRDGHEHGYKNLYIMDALEGEAVGEPVRLTEGPWTDTHCQWSPNNNWIVFSSNRANASATKKEDLPDPGYFGVYLVHADNHHTIKVIDSGYIGHDLFPGHVNHPYFSPDGKTIVVAADLAAVSCEPISLPLFSHSVRPYGDIFLVDLDNEEFEKNENLTDFKRLTHSRYENSTAVWTMYSTENTQVKWNNYIDDGKKNKLPFIDPSKGESFLVTGHLCIGRRCC